MLSRIIVLVFKLITTAPIKRGIVQMKGVQANLASRFSAQT